MIVGLFLRRAPQPGLRQLADRFRIHREMVLAGLVPRARPLTMSFAEQELTYIVGALLFGTGG